MRLRDLAASRVRFGYRRLTVLLKREGWRVNAKRIYRLNTEEGLTVRTKYRRTTANRSRVPQAVATAPNQQWSMDFVNDRLVDDRWFRVLTVVDQFTRECLLLYADRALSGEKVATQLECVTERGVPSSSRSTMEANSPVEPWMRGRTVTAFIWTSFDPASP